MSLIYLDNALRQLHLYMYSYRKLHLGQWPTDKVNFSKFCCHHPIAFVNQCLYLFSEQTQLLEHYIFICHLLHVSPFGHHQIDFTTTYTEKYTEVKTSLSQFIHSLACAECNNFLLFSGASSIPLCYIPFPSTLFHQLVFHPLSCHLAVYFVVSKFIYNTFLGILFSSILCACPNQHNIFNLTVSVLVGVFNHCTNFFIG